MAPFYGVAVAWDPCTDKEERPDMRFFVKLFLLLLLGFTLPGWGFAGEPVEQSRQQHQLVAGKGLLWKVVRNGGRPSYLYGTMHVGDPRVTTLAPKAQQLFDGAESLSLELTLDYLTMAEVMRGMYFSDGRTLSSVLGQELYTQLLELLSRRGIGQGMVANMKPWAVMTLLVLPEEQQDGAALDAQLYTRAQKQGKRVFGLETAQEQMSIFDSMSTRAQVQMVRSVMETEDKMEAMLDEMMRLYLDGDLQGLLEFSDSMTADYPSLAQAFNRIAIDERNVRMVERMQSRLREGNAFVAVGALHLPGERGILNLLAQRGFRVTPVR